MADKTLLIKRYPNRKLYDTTSSKYVNLADIAALVEEGTAVTIIDNRTGEDLTRQMLAQIMVEKEKQNRKNAPEFLQRMLGSLNAEPLNEFLDKVRRNTAGSTEAIEHAREDLEKQIQKWVDKGQVTRDEIRHYFDGLQGRMEKITHSTGDAVGGFFDKMVSKLDPAADADLLKRIDILEKRIDVLEDRLSRMKNS